MEKIDKVTALVKEKYAAWKVIYRENEVLDLIVKEHTTKAIAAKLFVSTKTVESHRSNLI